MHGKTTLKKEIQDVSSEILIEKSNTVGGKMQSSLMLGRVAHAVITGIQRVNIVY
jgi:hypothetical protein